MSLTQQDLKQIRFIVNDVVSDIRQRLERVEENTAVTRRILEKNELNEKSSFGRRLLKLESGMQKIGVAASSAK